MTTLQDKLQKWNLNSYLSQWPSQFIPLQQLWHIPQDCIVSLAKHLKMNDLDQISFHSMMHEIYAERDLHYKRNYLFEKKIHGIVDLTEDNNKNNQKNTNGIVDLTEDNNKNNQKNTNGIVDLTEDNDVHIDFKIEDNNLQMQTRKSNRNKKCLNFNYCDCHLVPGKHCGDNDDCINRESNTECTKKICNLPYNQCLNRRFQKRDIKKIYKKKTKNKGYGLFTYENIPKNSFIIEYEGKFIGKNECNYRIYHKYKYNKNFYIIKIGSNKYIDAENSNCLAKYANHSCSPNCKISVWIVNETQKVALFALRNIDKHEELCFDYKYECWNNTKQPCFCNSNNCNGFLC